jgi:hypothetical protein
MTRIAADSDQEDANGAGPLGSGTVEINAGASRQARCSVDG